VDEIQKFRPFGHPLQQLNRIVALAAFQLASNLRRDEGSSHIPSRNGLLVVSFQQVLDILPQTLDGLLQPRALLWGKPSVLPFLPAKGIFESELRPHRVVTAVRDRLFEVCLFLIGPGDVRWHRA